MNRMTLLFAMAAGLLVSATHAQASNQFASQADHDNYFTVQKIEIREIPTSSRLNGSIENLIQTQLAHHYDVPKTGPTTGVGQSIISVLTDPANVEAWVTLGEKAWQVILANKPVANVATKRVSVLPMAQQDWSAMDSWAGPAHKSYTVEAKNLFGVSVVSHVYTVAFNYGGKLNGKGQFLANATVIPSSVQVAWGYTLNSGVEVGETVNMGAKDSPTPGVDLQLAWSIDTVVKHAEARDDFFVRGDGEVVRMNGTN